MRLIVTGGRDFQAGAVVYGILDLLHKQTPVERVAQGGARGADQLAREWATLNGIECITYPADWNTHGRAAGPIRNAVMLAAEQALDLDLVVAFDGGKGTQGMVSLALKAGVKVWRIHGSGPYRTDLLT